MKWLAQTTIYRDSVDLVAIEEVGGVRYVFAPIDLFPTKIEGHQVIERPTLSIDPTSAKSLLQALWDAGLRPADWSSPDGEINALRAHIGFAEHVAKRLLSGPE